MGRQKIVLAAFSGIITLFSMVVSVAAQTEKECRKPPKLIYQPKLSAEDVSQIKSSSLTGGVAGIVDENGTVTNAKVLSASPKEGAQILFDAVMTAKFKPRPGCAPLNIDFIFSLVNK
jgi:hypothetical protein